MSSWHWGLAKVFVLPAVFVVVLLMSWVRRAWKKNRGE